MNNALRKEKMKKHPKKKYGKCKCGKVEILWYWRNKYQCDDCLNEEDEPATLENNFNTYNRGSAIADMPGMIDGMKGNCEGVDSMSFGKQISRAMVKHKIPGGEFIK